MSTIIREGKVIQKDGVRTEEGMHPAGRVDPARVPVAGEEAPTQPNDDPSSSTYGKPQIAPDVPLAAVAAAVHESTDGAVTAKNVATVATAQNLALDTRGGSEPAGEADETDEGEADENDTTWQEEADGVRVDGPNGAWYDVVDVIHDTTSKEQGETAAKAKAESLRERHRNAAAKDAATDA